MAPAVETPVVEMQEVEATMSALPAEILARLSVPPEDPSVEMPEGTLAVSVSQRDLDALGDGEVYELLLRKRAFGLAAECAARGARVSRRALLRLDPQHPCADEVATLLIDAGADPNTDRGAALEMAARAGNVRLARALVRGGAPVRVRSGEVAMITAARRGDVAMAVFLLGEGLDIDATPALAEAAQRRQGAFVAEMLARGARPKSSALVAAYEAGDSEIFTLLIKHGASAGAVLPRPKRAAPARGGDPGGSIASRLTRVARAPTEPPAKRARKEM